MYTVTRLLKIAPNRALEFGLVDHGAGLYKRTDPAHIKMWDTSLRKEWDGFSMLTAP
eukprot:COSAG01_NODE_1823_length_9143_cov_7.938640_9_plen_57_part_00